MKYFKTITDTSRHLLAITSNYWSVQNSFKTALADAKHQLEASLRDGDDLSSLPPLPPEEGDGLDLMKELNSSPSNGTGNNAVNQFATEIASIMETILKYCVVTIQKSDEAKDKLRKAVIWGDL